MYIIKAGDAQQLLQKTIPYCFVFGPISANLLLAGFCTPLHLLAGNHT
jgi:hypothetical protein